MIVTVCIGSYCHIKGSRLVLECLQNRICENGLEDKVRLKGTFCIGKCQEGVCVTINDEVFSVTPDSADEFFEKQIKAKF